MPLSISWGRHFIFTSLEKRFVLRGLYGYSAAVLQIVFNEISAAELSRMDTLDQLDLLDSFQVTREKLEDMDGGDFAKLERDDKVLYRFRAKEYRIYFEVQDDLVVVHRVLHKNTFSDFLFRSKMPVGEDEALSQSKHFWKLIDEGRNARRM
ncbi:hypothetical protein Rhal01_02940 [Rubritalea halochordaticola]|uniref:Type II toxin-antitoxin system RelE/ParE family toxin n=1 Tax=Rubritalea halochordaticola TaxID=714537 RepID=A0ABP9V2B1_9BACT